VDDAALFPPGNAAMPDAVREHLAGRAGRRAGVLGLFLCTASRLPELITELIKAKPASPIGLSLVVDTGLGGLPKAVSIVESRTELLALRMVEMPAPSDVDEVWLERVDEFVPEDAIRVIEPRRGGEGWLEGVRRVADRGYWPKLRCGGQSAEAFPSLDQVADFLGVLAGVGQENNYGQWSSSEFDAAIDQARAADDPAAAAAGFDRAEAILQDQAPLFAVAYGGPIFELARPGLVGVARSGLGVIRWASVRWGSS